MIVVFGGTGTVGRKVVSLLLRERQQVRAVSRVPGRARANLPAGVEVVGGDVLDASSLRPALSGATTVVCTVHGGDGKGTKGPGGIEGRGIPNLVRAARAARVAHFVYVSSASARPDSPAELFRLKAAAESELRASGIRYSILRPTHLLDTWAPMLARPLAAKSRAMLVGRGSNPVSWVAGDDIAAVAAQRAAAAGDDARTFDLGGPEALTMRQLNERFEQALGVRVKRTTTMPPAALRLASSLLKPFNEVLARQMQLGLLLDGQPQAINSQASWEETGVTPATVAEWLRAHLPAYLAEWGLASRADHTEARGNA
jgi:uncharacterized protein YbjT (DUF2867 family)